MNLILLFEEDLRADGTARLTGRRAAHVREVHRAEVGDELTVGRLGGLVGRGSVVSIAPGETVLEVRFSEPPPDPSPFDLLLAMPRPKILRKVLQAVASLGVKRLVLVNSYRVEKSYFDSPLLEPDSVREQLVLGLEQARDTILPEVLVRERFKPFVEDELEGFWPEGVRKLIGHPTAKSGLEELGAGEGRGVVAIGPEGGWIPYEVAMLEQRGFQPFTLGARILRVDVAVPYIYGQLDLARCFGKRPGARGSAE